MQKTAAVRIIEIISTLQNIKQEILVQKIGHPAEDTEDMSALLNIVKHKNKKKWLELTHMQ